MKLAFLALIALYAAHLVWRFCRLARNRRRGIMFKPEDVPKSHRRRAS